MRTESETIPTLVQLAAELANATGWGDVDDLHELSAGYFEAATRGRVFRVAGDPDRIDAESAGEGKKQGYRTRSIVMPAVRAMHAIADMTRVSLEVRRRSDAEINLSQLFCGRLAEHTEGVSGDSMERMNGVVGEA